jgi:ABC-type branched-subunit amino acid transport system ATPase component
MENYCVLENVTVSFGGVKANDDVSLVIDSKPGIMGIIGPNGAGKSTALNVIAGARRATSGRVEVMGKTLRGNADPGAVARMGVGRTFQIPRPFGQMTLRENVMVGLISKKFRLPQAHEKTSMDILEQVGLASIANSTAGALPLAARKKLELARVMSIEPKMMLLDEVFEGLSDQEIQDIVTILKGLRDRGIRLVMVEHVIRALRQLATELVVFEKGKIIAQGEITSVLDSDEVKKAYLGFGKSE